MKQPTAILGLLAETSIHAGAGHSAGPIDLPIQREAHTDWPCVYGSAVKGALRARAEDRQMPKDLRWSIFGPDTDNASDHAGALIVGDARLVLLPVRSLTGHFKWVTCPALLRRLREDRQRLGGSPATEALPLPAVDKAILPAGSSDSLLFLEEFRLEVVTGDLTSVIGELADLFPDPQAGDRLSEQLAVVDDDLFGYLARFAVPVAAHVRIDNKTKTVESGALWYEETLPPDTLLYVALAAWASRSDLKKSSAQVLSETLAQLFGEQPYLQLGGNETVGMGWCRVQLPTVEG